MKNIKNALLLKQLYQLKELGYRYTSATPYKDKEPNFSLPSGLDNLKKEATNCHMCELSKHRDKVVFGLGSSSANIIFVGDTPSISDNNTGTIFSDRAGDMLVKMIENVIGIQKEDAYLSNILKCRALDSSNPSATYSHTCLPYVIKEIEIIKPKIVVALGESVYHYLTGENDSIEIARGTPYKKDGYIIVATYHPNFLLRNPSAKKDVFEDLKKIKEMLNKTSP